MKYKIIALFVVVCLILGFNPDKSEKTFVGFFAKHITLDTVSQFCVDPSNNAMLYSFVDDTTRISRNRNFLYGLLKCPTNINKSMLNHHTKLKISYRFSNKEDLKGINIMNRHKFFGVNYCIITSIVPYPQKVKN